MANPFENRGGPEGSGSIRPQRKIGLETPIHGSFWGENKRLVFSPPIAYQILVAACLLGGGVLIGGSYLGWGFVPPVLRAMVWLGPAVLMAGVWAVLSMEFVVFDTRSMTYVRREGGGVFKRTRRGSLIDVDAVVLYCEHYPLSIAGQTVIYRIVIHWKNARVPLLIAERHMAALPTGVPLNHGAGRLNALAQRYAQALGVRYHDNSYFHSPAPQSAL